MLLNLPSLCGEVLCTDIPMSARPGRLRWVQGSLTLRTLDLVDAPTWANWLKICFLFMVSNYYFLCLYLKSGPQAPPNYAPKHDVYFPIENMVLL